MKVDFEKIMVSPNGSPITELIDGQDRPVSLKNVAVNALLAALPDERNMLGEEKLKRYTLALKINEGSEQELTVDEIALIKKLIGKSFSTVICGQAWMMLEGQKTPEPKQLDEKPTEA